MKSNIKLTGIMLITVAMIIGLTPFVNNMQIYPSANAFDMDEIQISCILNSCNEDNSASSTNIDDDSITCTAEQETGGGDNSTNIVANICGVNTSADPGLAETISPTISLPV